MFKHSIVILVLLAIANAETVISEHHEIDPFNYYNFLTLDTPFTFVKNLIEGM